MSYSVTDEQDYPRITPAVQWLIAINIAIFFLQLTIVSDADMRGAFAFQLRDLTEQPWTVLTYMFVHGGFMHLAFNMYTLWVFGRRLEHAWSPGSFARYYVWCGLGAWLFHLMLNRNGDGLLLGASGAVYGVMLAYAMRWPDDEVLFFFVPVKVKWLVVGLTVLNLMLGLSGASGVAYFAHLGGFAFGWMYLRWTSSGTTIERLRQRMSQLPDVPDETPRAVPRSHPHTRERRDGIDEIIAKSKALVAKRPASLPTMKALDPKAEALNLVLDKISEKGIGSLTNEEKRLLEEFSRRLRKGGGGRE